MRRLRNHRARLLGAQIALKHPGGFEHPECCPQIAHDHSANLTFGLLATLLVAGTAAAANRPDRLPTITAKSADAAARQVDVLIDDHLRETGVAPLPPASDEDFLRRASLDLAGRIPTPRDVTLFGLNPDENKRSAAVDDLLETEDFARTWASYWREVIFSRATEVRSRVGQPAFEDWMTEQLRSNKGWNEITTDLLTATGNTRENGSTALMFAHGGDPAEVAGEVSRIFLGIQIQCANCHDHPYDQWKREDFHELAAFFPRVRLRRDGKAKPAAFSIDSVDNDRPLNRKGLDADYMMRLLDRNRDGKVTKQESKKHKQFTKRFDKVLAAGDKNGDGAMSRKEFKELPLPPVKKSRRTPEYYMPDLENPAELGTRTQPVFFVNDKSVSFGATDMDRRGALAMSVTSPDNPWFARAFVNRIWAEMLGEGFYSPIDDMGPERTARDGDVLDLLAAGFVANDYDVKWVYRTIARTAAYQRSSASEGRSDDLPAFAAASPTRLRGDQLYNAVTQVLGVETLGRKMARNMRNGKGIRGGTDDPARAAFGLLFNYDASMPQEDLMGNIPQALFMMNSPILQAAINGDRQTTLSRILDEFEDDNDALNELYLRVLVREPTPDEATICRAYLAEVGNRTQGFEDVMWSLMNSTEFLTKR